MPNLNPRYARYAARLRELIEEGKKVAGLETRGHSSSWIQGENKVPLHAWLTKTQNIIEGVFGANSQQLQHLHQLTQRTVEYAHQVYSIVGLLEGALNDLENGFLRGQEFIVAGEVFDSVLQRAKYLVDNGFKDAAAVLVRVVIEDALKRIAREEGLDDSKKASAINDDLKGAKRYPQPQWRLIQSWLDIGNSAAHGDFGDYTEDDVKRMIDDVERFLAAELH